MKFLACLLLFTIGASAEAYPYMVVRYDYSTFGGVTSLNVYLHNNGGKTEEAVVATAHGATRRREPRRDSFCRRRLPRIQVQSGRR